MRDLFNSRGSLLRSVLAVTVGIALVACGGDGGDGDDDSDVSLATPSGTASAVTTPSAIATPEAIEEAVWPSLGMARVTTEDLNVRAGPGLGFPVLGRLQPDDEVPVSGRGSDGRWLALPGIGWAAYDDTWVELPVSLDELPVISPEESNYEFIALHPAGTVIDVPVVDQIVAAVAAGDRAMLLNLVVDPADASGSGDADDAEGNDDESAGEPAAVRPPNSSCEGGVLPATDLESNLDEFLTSSVGAQGPLRLYAVTGALGGEDVDAEFSIVFAFERGEARQLWPSPQGGIAWFTLDCGGLRPGDLLSTTEGADLFFWLRPLAPAPLDPVQ